MSPGGTGIERQGMLECFEGVVVVFFAAVHNAEQVVTLNARGIQLELFLYFLFGFFNRTLAQQGFGFKKR